PTTLPSDNTGKPLTPWVAINWAASLSEVLSLTETTSVVMRSRTFMSRHSFRRYQPPAVGGDMPGPFLPYPSGTWSKAPIRRLSHSHDRARGEMVDLLRGAPQEQRADVAQATGAEDDHLRLGLL